MENVDCIDDLAFAPWEDESPQRTISHWLPKFAKMEKVYDALIEEHQSTLKKCEAHEQEKITLKKEMKEELARLHSKISELATENENLKKKIEELNRTENNVNSDLRELLQTLDVFYNKIFSKLCPHLSTSKELEAAKRESTPPMCNISNLSSISHLDSMSNRSNATNLRVVENTSKEINSSKSILSGSNVERAIENNFFEESNEHCRPHDVPEIKEGGLQTHLLENKFKSSARATSYLKDIEDSRGIHLQVSSTLDDKISLDNYSLVANKRKLPNIISHSEYKKVKLESYSRSEDVGDDDNVSKTKFASINPSTTIFTQRKMAEANKKKQSRIETSKPNTIENKPLLNVKLPEFLGNSSKNYPKSSPKGDESSKKRSSHEKQNEDLTGILASLSSGRSDGDQNELYNGLVEEGELLEHDLESKGAQISSMHNLDPKRSNHERTGHSSSRNSGNKRNFSRKSRERSPRWY